MTRYMHESNFYQEQFFFFLISAGDIDLPIIITDV